MTVHGFKNPITDNAYTFVDHYVKAGWLEASQYYNTLNLPEQLKEQFKSEAQKEFNHRGISIHVKI
jgi:hypothetical protein